MLCPGPRWGGGSNSAPPDLLIGFCREERKGKREVKGKERERKGRGGKRKKKWEGKVRDEKRRGQRRGRRKGKRKRERKGRNFVQLCLVGYDTFR